VRIAQTVLITKTIKGHITNHYNYEKSSIITGDIYQTSHLPIKCSMFFPGDGRLAVDEEEFPSALKFIEIEKTNVSGLNISDINNIFKN
jgi:hypothetical protein